MSDNIFTFKRIKCNRECHSVMIPYSSINTSVFNGTLKTDFPFFFCISNTFVSFNSFSFCSNMDSGVNISMLEGTSVHCLTFSKLNCLRCSM